MSKKNEEAVDGSTVNTENQTTVESGHPAFVDDLLKHGTATLTATTHEELAAMVDQIPSDIHYGAGAVNHDYSQNIYTLNVFVTPKE